jgi:predicted phosphoribosyltransferase
VPVAGEVAGALRAPLDVFVVRKLGVPGHEEVAMGAVASGGVRVVQQDVVRAARVSRQVFDEETDRERHEVDRQERLFRAESPFPDVRDATVILVDDGVATGSTMVAGIQALRHLGASTIIAAAPVMSREAYDMLLARADGCECAAIPEPFIGVGAYYRDFSQTSDAEVREVLDRFRSRQSKAAI